ncbi:hypothetical protein Tco_1245542 [Tanacetum coccineum]
MRERKAGVVPRIGGPEFDCVPHGIRIRWPQIYCGHPAAPAKDLQCKNWLLSKKRIFGFSEEDKTYDLGVPLNSGVPRSRSSPNPHGCAYTEDEDHGQCSRGQAKQGDIPVLDGFLKTGTVIPPTFKARSSISRLKKRGEGLTKQVNMFMRLFRSDDKFYQMLTQLESQPEYGGGSGSGGCGDDEPGDDEDDDKDEEDDDDS